MLKTTSLFISLQLIFIISFGQKSDELKILADEIYSRKDGMALTMDMIAPTNSPNRAAVVIIVSGGYRSGPFFDSPLSRTNMTEAFTSRGFTVFTVAHGASPVYSIPDILEDVKLSIRYIRKNADSLGVDANRIGAYGSSSGGHLAMSLGVIDNDVDLESEDEIGRFSSKVNAVVAFFPPTDYLNFGGPGVLAEESGLLDGGGRPAPFNFHRIDPESGHYVRIVDESVRLEITRAISPIYDISADDAPILLLHGDADPRVPIQQSLDAYEKFQAAGVVSELHIEENGGHGRWESMPERMEQSASWFEVNLLD